MSSTWSPFAKLLVRQPMQKVNKRHHISICNENPNPPPAPAAEEAAVVADENPPPARTNNSFGSASVPFTEVTESKVAEMTPSSEVTVLEVETMTSMDSTVPEVAMNPMEM